MSEKVAVIASVLKPVDDTRMFEKLGLSIRESKKYRVNIIGFGVKKPPVTEGMEFHSIYSGNRVGLGRLLVPWRFFIKLLSLRPQLLVVCTPELLIPGVVFKLLWGSQLWYDVQENYQLNVTYQDAYLWALKPLIRLGVWLIENSSTHFVDLHLLAEKGYEKELKFLNGNQIVLENKFVSLRPISKNEPGNTTKMIFSGTCSKENGIIQAISLVTTLHQYGYPVQLTIIGHVPDPSVLSMIQNLAKQTDFIRLVGNGSLVPHTTVMEQASKADIGLVAHQPNPSTENCIPTKIYEYLGLRIPMILQKHPLWESVVHPYQAAVVIDFLNFNPEKLWAQIQDTRFYLVEPGPEITWEQESVKLLEQL